MAEIKTISYAKVVTPSATNGNEVQHENKMEPKEDTEDMPVTVTADTADDNEGFLPVTNKKNEKLKEKEKDVKKKNKSRKKIRSSKEKMKEKDRDKEKDGSAPPEKSDSKESSPTPSKPDEQVEFVPAPPPKNNPWKKAAKPDTVENLSTDPDATSTSNPTSTTPATVTATATAPAS